MRPKRSETASRRQQFVFSEAQSASLDRIAAREGVTKTEVVHRALGLYDQLEGFDVTELEEVVQLLRRTMQQTVAKVDAALEEISRLSDAEQREMDRQEVRDEVQSWAAEHPEQLDALADLLRTAGTTS